MNTTGALQDWLALEHEAVWLHAMIGGRFPELGDAARTAYTSHRAVRDRLLAHLHTAGVEPVSTGIAYDIGDLTTVKQARSIARRLEQSIAAACLTLAGISAEQRAFAMSGLRRAALADLAWGGHPTAFPGLP